MPFHQIFYITQTSYPPRNEVLTNCHFIDCTAKAVSHRLSNIRTGGATGRARATGGANRIPPQPAIAKKPRGCAMPVSKKKIMDESDGPEGLLDDEHDFSSPVSDRGKSGKRAYISLESDDEEDHTEKAKRVKTELQENEDWYFNNIANGDDEEDEV